MNGFLSWLNNHNKSPLPSLFDCEVFICVHTHTCIRQVLKWCFAEQPKYFRDEMFRYLRATTSCESPSSRNAPSLISKIHCLLLPILDDILVDQYILMLFSDDILIGQYILLRLSRDIWSTNTYCCA